ncbi:M4 family metallopeptidase [Kitasatospora aburaviensis]
MPGPKLLGVAIAVVLGLGVGVPPAFAGPAAGPATGPAGAPSADADPVPGLVAGSETTAPQLVTGLADAAPGDNPADAARAHLAAHQDRYRVDPAQLAEAGTERAADGRRTVKFDQQHGGVPVFGARYLVHLVGEGAGQRVESVGGKFFTGLTVPTAQTVPDDVLRRLAVDASQDPAARVGAAAEDHGLVVLPGGAGRLARHFTVRGTDPAIWAAKAREVFVDATVGEVALSYEVRAPYLLGDSSAKSVAPSAKAAAPSAGAAGAEPATGTAPDALGRPAQVNIGRLPDGTYQLVDLTRPAAITTYDAAGRDVMDFSRALPADARPAASASPDFPASTGTSGATDAHLNAAAVYDFYRDRLGRDGIDGKAGPITSVVNVTSSGEPLENAYWDGQKMIYSGGSEKRHPFSVARDVAGHEMTHGVVGHTAGLVNLGQSGALDEAVADYFGNAIEVTSRGIPMTDPRAALLGEDLCRTGTPEACADRRMDDRRTTVADYVGAPAGVDSGGVHLNSTIFSGALWDIRRSSTRSSPTAWSTARSPSTSPRWTTSSTPATRCSPPAARSASAAPSSTPWPARSTRTGSRTAGSGGSAWTAARCCASSRPRASRPTSPPAAGSRPPRGRAPRAAWPCTREPSAVRPSPSGSARRTAARTAGPPPTARPPRGWPWAWAPTAPGAWRCWPGRSTAARCAASTARLTSSSVTCGSPGATWPSWRTTSPPGRAGPHCPATAPRRCGSRCRTVTVPRTSRSRTACWPGRRAGRSVSGR